MQQIINYSEINNAVMTDTMEMCRLVESLKKSIDNSIKNELLKRPRPIKAKRFAALILRITTAWEVPHGVLERRKSQCAAFQLCIPVCRCRNKLSIKNIL